MSTDPYDVVQAEIQSTLASAGTLLSSYKRIRSTARENSEEVVYARNELKAALSTLEADLEDLEESVRVVEQTGPRVFGLDDAEVQTRRRYVRDVRRELENMRVEVASSQNASTSYGSRQTAGARSPRPEDDGRHEDDQAAWSRMEQQMIMQEQDKTIDSITGTVAVLTEQAGLMGHEIEEHIEMLDDLEANVDSTDSKLQKNLKRLKQFVRETEETKSGWCIGILVVILMVLLLMVILL